jgi:hypothetical protein
MSCFQFLGPNLCVLIRIAGDVRALACIHGSGTFMACEVYRPALHLVIAAADSLQWVGVSSRVHEPCGNHLAEGCLVRVQALGPGGEADVGRAPDGRSKVLTSCSILINFLIALHRPRHWLQEVEDVRDAVPSNGQMHKLLMSDWEVLQAAADALTAQQQHLRAAEGLVMEPVGSANRPLDLWVAVQVRVWAHVHTTASASASSLFYTPPASQWATACLVALCVVLAVRLPMMCGC